MMVEALAVGDPRAAIDRKSSEEEVDQIALAYARFTAHQHELALAPNAQLEPAIEFRRGAPRVRRGVGVASAAPSAARRPPV